MDYPNHEPYRVRERRQHREQILQAAEHHLTVVGCERFTLDLVARQVGLARTALYRHVGSRTALIEQVLAEAGARAVARFDDVSPHEPSATIGQVLGAYARVAVDQTLRNHAATGNHQLAYPCCLHLRTCPFASLDTLSPAILVKVQTTPQMHVFPASDPSRLARLLWALLCEVLVDSRGAKAAELDRAIGFMVHLVDGGLASR